MRFFRVFLFLLLTAPFQIGAAPAADSTSPPVPLLWKASNGARAVYLLGSFHMLKPDDYPLADAVDAAFDDSGTVLFELPPEDLDPSALAVAMYGEALYGADESLRDDVSPQLWQRLRTHVSSNRSSFPLPVLERFKPWMVAMMINIDEIQRRGMASERGLDNYFINEAKAAGKTVGGLETMREQIDVLARMTKAEQRQMLSEALDVADGSDEVEHLHDLWRRGEADALWSEMSESMRRDYPDLYQRINVDRNRAWLPQIEHRLREGENNTLVVVGAMHLVGEDGLVTMLRGRGYLVGRICSECGRGD
ncbi:MAG: TraB/GumN family protein [Xanthomonadaceae bacterium]|nr:TraB/GumN family protein [Xanthomonadaceae bacterium]